MNREFDMFSSSFSKYKHTKKDVLKITRAVCQKVNDLRKKISHFPLNYFQVKHMNKEKKQSDRILCIFCVVFFFSLIISRRTAVRILMKINRFYMAYFWVHCRAVALYFSLSVLYVRAISGTSGSSGFGSQSNEQIESNTLDIVNAGDH